MALGSLRIASVRVIARVDPRCNASCSTEAVGPTPGGFRPVAPESRRVSRPNRSVDGAPPPRIVALAGVGSVRPAGYRVRTRVRRPRNLPQPPQGRRPRNLRMARPPQGRRSAACVRAARRSPRCVVPPAWPPLPRASRRRTHRAARHRSLPARRAPASSTPHPRPPTSPSRSRTGTSPALPHPRRATPAPPVSYAPRAQPRAPPADARRLAPASYAPRTQPRAPLADAPAHNTRPRHQGASARPSALRDKPLRGRAATWRPLR